MTDPRRADGEVTAVRSVRSAFAGWRAAALTGVASCLALTACAYPGSGAQPSTGAAPPNYVLMQLAQRAGHLMTATHGPLPSRAAAWDAVANLSDATVSAVAVSGNTWGGSVVLKIMAVAGGSAGAGPEPPAGCFTYRFTYPRQADWGLPTAVACGIRQAVDLREPPLPSGVTTTTRNVVLATADRLTPTSRTVASAVQAPLSRALGSDYYVQSGLLDPGVVFTWIRYGDGCLTLRTSSSELTLSQVISGTDCFGG